MPIRFFQSQLAVLSAMAALSAAGCNVSGRNDTPEVPPPAGPPVVNATMTYPDGWDTIVLNANYAETRIFSNAHWSTDRTACGMDAYGAYKLESWNPLAAAMNQALASPPLAEDNCFDYPLEYKMDGNAKAVLDGGKERTLFSNRGYQACTTISDQALAERLLKLFNDTVLVVDQAKDNCPFGS